MTATYDDVMISLGLEPSSEPDLCGSYRGYARHRRRGEAPCDDCRTANAEYKRARRHAPKDPAGLPPIKHGTPQGEPQHRYRGEQPCEDCRKAYNASCLERRRDYDRNRRKGARRRRSPA